MPDEKIIFSTKWWLTRMKLECILWSHCWMTDDKMGVQSVWIYMTDADWGYKPDFSSCSFYLKSRFASNNNYSWHEKGKQIFMNQNNVSYICRRRVVKMKWWCCGLKSFISFAQFYNFCYKIEAVILEWFISCPRTYY